MAGNRHATPFINHKLFICVAVSLLLPMANEGAPGLVGDSRSYTSDDGKRLTREYHLRQGALRGLIVKPSRHYDLQPIEMFLGIPYAAPPTGSLRFMPPGNDKFEALMISHLHMNIFKFTVMSVPSLF